MKLEYYRNIIEVFSIERKSIKVKTRKVVIPLFLALILAAGYLLTVNFRLLIRSGFVRDEHTVVNDPGRFLWFSLFALILVIVLSAAELLKRRVKPGVWSAAAVLLCCGLLVFSYMVFGQVRERYDEIEGVSLPESRKLMLEELESLKDQNMSGVLYIGKDGCPACETAYPQLAQVVAQYDLDWMEYDTSADRESARDQTLTVPDELNVRKVPAVLLLRDGAVVMQGEGEALAKQLKAFLVEEKQTADTQK